MDVKNKYWSKEMLEICSITEEQLPKLYESYEGRRILKEEYCRGTWNDGRGKK